MNTSLPFQFEVDTKFSSDEIYQLTNFETKGRQSYLKKSLFNFDFVSSLLSSKSEQDVMNEANLDSPEKVKSLRIYLKQIVNSLNLTSDETVELNYLRGTIDS
jgi:hypothetical protein